MFEKSLFYQYKILDFIIELSTFNDKLILHLYYKYYLLSLSFIPDRVSFIFSFTVSFLTNNFKSLHSYSGLKTSFTLDLYIQFTSENIAYLVSVQTLLFI